VFDSKFDRVIITKLDYIPQPGKEVFYDEVAKEFYVNQPVAGDLVVKKYIEVTDLEYFCNKSWTASFNFNTKSWVSFHTYLPNFYIGENNFFYSGLNEGCDITAVAVTEIPSPTTTTTTTRIIYCNLTGTAVYVVPPTTTTTSTSTSTSTSTTTSTSTSTSTSTTSTTTTPAPVSLYRYSSASSEDACTTGLVMDNVVLTDPPFCSATAIQCDQFVLEAAGISIYVRSGNSYRTATINDPNTSGIATFDVGTCIVCTTSTTSTTSSTTTAAPVARTVTNITASASDILGEIYIDASVTLSGTVNVNTIIEVRVSTVPYGDVFVPVAILSGNSSGIGSTFVGLGSLPSVSGQCVTSSDNINVTFAGFEC
jgi:hypothetical protein